MEFAFWFIGIGSLLIAMNVGGGLIARLPLSPAILYFAFGVALGPWGLGWLLIDPVDHAVVIERICEFAVLVSLFATGSNLGGTLRGRHWSVPMRLASVAMLATIAALAAFAYGVLDFSLGAAVLMAAILAPTDPVLAGDVQVADPADRDRLRFGLTGEGGLNDGAAFPFVMLGLGLLSLHEIGPGGWRWWAVDLVWAVVVGLAVGAILGVALGRWLVRRNRGNAGDAGSDAFLGLGLVAVAYGIAVVLHAYGFLAVFAAAVALQWTVSGAGIEVGGDHLRDPPRPDPDTTGSPGIVASPASAPATATEAIVAPLQRFNEHLESLFEFGVVMMVGAFFAVVRVPWEAFAVIAVLFLVIRPASVLLALYGTRLDREQRVLAGWFGIRGVGSMYYAMYAINHGLPGATAELMLGITTAVVAASIFLHGISVTPLMTIYGRGKARMTRRSTFRMPGR
jgi:NhaP-type Na+/H+ or K+/H+ antiporter